MTEVMDDILAATGGSIDLLVATHEHWDHVSGFAQAAESSPLKVGAVWLGWTEDPKDADAKTAARRARQRRSRCCAPRAVRMQMAGDADRRSRPADFAARLLRRRRRRTTTASARELVQCQGARPRYCAPEGPCRSSSTAPRRIYTLGPPRDMKMLKKIAAVATAPETYGLALAAAGAVASAQPRWRTPTSTAVRRSMRLPDPEPGGAEQPFFQPALLEPTSRLAPDRLRLDGRRLRTRAAPWTA